MKHNVHRTPYVLRGCTQQFTVTVKKLKTNAVAWEITGGLIQWMGPPNVPYHQLKRGKYGFLIFGILTIKLYMKKKKAESYKMYYKED